MDENVEPVRVDDRELDFDQNQVFYYLGRPFTGIAFSDEPGGGRSEISYKHGLQHGSSREWYGNGHLKGESYYIENTAHGTFAEYSSSGDLVRKDVYEYAIRVASTTFASDGTFAAWALDASDPLFARLERLRRERGWPAPT